MHYKKIKSPLFGGLFLLHMVYGLHLILCRGLSLWGWQNIFYFLVDLPVQAGIIAD
jgi:hypothetical protein